MTQQSTINWHKAALEITPRTGIFINGKWHKAQTGETISRVSPVDGRTLPDVASGDDYDVDLAVRSARKAFDLGVWSRAAPAHRKRVLCKLAQLILDNRDELALLDTLDMGKPISAARDGDIVGAATCFSWYGEACDKIYGELAPTRPDAIATIRNVPLGVVGAVVPWNFPLYMAAWKLAPALAVGNSVVLKPAEQSSYSVLRLAELAIEAGLPEGVLNIVPGLGPTAGAALGQHMDVDCLTFTGSTEVGKLFMRYSGGSNMKRVSLECGGKSPNIVLADCADIGKAARVAAEAIFNNQGQVCNAGSRLIVERSIHDEFVEAVKIESQKFVPSDPLDEKTRSGALVDKGHAAQVLQFVTGALEEGANLVTGGETSRVESGGAYFLPTIFSNVTPEMTLARDEVFGPVLAVLAVDTAQEAIAIANASNYALAAAVWTQDIVKANRVADQLHAGMVWINAYGAGDMSFPFGGFKQSGFGRDRSLHAMDKYCDLKSIWTELS